MYNIKSVALLKFGIITSSANYAGIIILYIYIIPWRYIDDIVNSIHTCSHMH